MVIGARYVQREGLQMKFSLVGKVHEEEADERSSLAEDSTLSPRRPFPTAAIAPICSCRGDQALTATLGAGCDLSSVKILCSSHLHYLYSNITFNKSIVITLSPEQKLIERNSHYIYLYLTWLTLKSISSNFPKQKDYYLSLYI